MSFGKNHKPLAAAIQGGVGRMETEIRVAIASVADIVAARQRARDLAFAMGFSPAESTVLAAVISELARNIVLYAKSGEMSLRVVNNGARRGVEIVAADNGPGIADVQRALMGGYSTSGGLGLGLCGVRRIMDELDIDSRIGGGTIVTARKWQCRE